MTRTNRWTTKFHLEVKFHRNLNHPRLVDRNQSTSEFSRVNDSRPRRRYPAIWIRCGGNQCMNQTLPIPNVWFINPSKPRKDQRFCEIAQSSAIWHFKGTSKDKEKLNTEPEGVYHGRNRAIKRYLALQKHFKGQEKAHFRSRGGLPCEKKAKLPKAPKAPVPGAQQEMKRLEDQYKPPACLSKPGFKFQPPRNAHYARFEPNQRKQFERDTRFRRSFGRQAPPANLQPGKSFAQATKAGKPSATQRLFGTGFGGWQIPFSVSLPAVPHTVEDLKSMMQAIPWKI